MLTASPAASIAWLVVVSLGASALGGMMGMASGIFIVPLLTLFGGLPMPQAVGASLVSVIACSCASAPHFLEGGLTNVRLAILLEAGTTLGALTGILIAGSVSTSFLLLLFALVLFLSAIQMLKRRKENLADPGKERPTWFQRLNLHASYLDPREKTPIPYRVDRVGTGIALMYAAGVISALLGIGSGVLKVPAMDSALRLPIKVSSATSNFMIGVTAAAGAGAYFLRGHIVGSIAGPVAIGSVIGSAAGAKLLVRLPNDKIRLIFATVLLLLAIQMLLAAFGFRPMLAGAS